MKTKTSVLSTRELQILRLLSQGKTSLEIRRAFGLDKNEQPLMSLPNLHTHCYNIRQKTGIVQTRDAGECRRYLRTLGQTLQHKALELPERLPTPRQMEVLRLVADGHPYREIARVLGIDRQSAQNAASAGAHRAGITNAGWQRTKLIRAWLARHDAEQAACEPVSAASPMADPMF